MDKKCTHTVLSGAGLNRIPALDIMPDGSVQCKLCPKRWISNEVLEEAEGEGVIFGSHNSPKWRERDWL
jgi:hypothetical protein